MDEYGTIPMFEVPKKYKAPKKQADEAVPSWKAYKGKRTSCDHCILAIAKGQTKFLAENAAHVRTHLGVKAFLCNRHAMELKVQNGE